MNTKNYHHIPQNLLLFIMLVGLFALPVFSFTVFKPALSNTNEQVLGESTKVINGMSVSQNNGLYEISGIIPAKRSLTISLDSIIDNKKVYLLENTKGIIVTLNQNNVEVVNIQNTDINTTILLK